MSKKLMTICLVVIVCFGMLLSGCETGVTRDPRTNNALFGGAAGAGIGNLIGGDTQGTLIGAGIGAGLGWLAGGQVERQQQTQDELDRMRGEMNSVTIWITNSNGSQIPVKLIKNQPTGFIGPKGEYYPTMPTEDQLYQMYGF